MTHRILLAALILACTIVSVQAQEVALKKKQVPKNVLEAFAKTYPKATMKGFSKELEKGVTTFEVESVEGTIHRDVSFASDGSLIAVEESMLYAELPEAVRSSVAKEAPKGKVASCEKIIKGAVTQYELVVRSGKKKEELLFSADGALVERE